jgi:hypothetical protein
MRAGSPFIALRDFARATASLPLFWPSVAMAFVAIRVVWWLPMGNSPDGANSFSPAFPILQPFQLTAFPWNPVLENGFPNPQIPRFIESLPLYGLSALRLGPWATQVIWLFFLYWVGSAVAMLAAARIFPLRGTNLTFLLLVGVGYQLSPSLMFGLQDTAAFGLPIATYWGVPLLTYFVLKLDGTRNWWAPVGVGASTLLLMTEFPATLVPSLLLAVVLGVLLIVRLPRLVRWSRFAMIGGVAGIWVGIFNVWWALPEFLYRGQLLQNLGTNLPTGPSEPNHLASLIFLNWYWPDPSTYIGYMGSSWFLVSAFLIFCVAVTSIVVLWRTLNGFLIYSTWFLYLVLVYGSAPPLNGLYQAAYNTTVFSFLTRNPIHFAPTFDLLLAVVFAAGAEDAIRHGARVVGRALPHKGRAQTIPMGTSPHRRSNDHLARIFLTGGFVTILILAGWPLVSGQVVENVTYNGRVVVPATPPSRGVRVPAFYDEARQWLYSHDPGATTMVFPMPDTWLSAASHLSWGYEGTSAIYSTLLGEPLITNNAGTLTSTGFPAIASTYQIAASGGPPGAAVPLDMNRSVSIWSGFAQDAVKYEPTRGPGGSAEFAWSIYLGHDYGVNGHQFTWNLAQPLPQTSAYLGFWLDPHVAGQFSLTWAVNDTEVGWYPTSVPGGQWSYVLLPMSIPPTFNYNPRSLNVRSFPNASSMVFKFSPSALENESGVVELASFAVYPAVTDGIDYYLRSLGAHVIVVDRSIVATAADPLQNLSSYGALLREISDWRLATFGNLTLYELPAPFPMVYSPEIRSVEQYLLAWSQAQNRSTSFVTNATLGLPSDLAPAAVTYSSPNPGEYVAEVRASGPFVLGLLQNFNPQWVATSGATTYSEHFVLNGFANGWYINRTGTFAIVLIFGPTTVYGAAVVACLVSGLTLVLIAIPSSRARLNHLAKSLFRSLWHRNRR